MLCTWTWPTWHFQNWRARLDEDVADDIIMESQFVALALAAGINDATTFPEYHVFVSNQTGNTALLAVGSLGLSQTVDLPNIGFSLGMFILGGLIFGQIGDRLGRRKKAWLLTTNVVQTVTMFAGAALRKWLPGNSKGPPAWGVISLLALASGGQVAMARTVNLPRIPTAMVTSAYIDFLVDPDLLQRHNRGRNRRLFFVTSLLVGSFVGAVGYRYVAPSFSLLLAAICKALVCISFLFNSPVSTDSGPSTKRRRRHRPLKRTTPRSDLVDA